MVASAKKGRWHGQPPYGYDRLYYDEKGEFYKRIARGDLFHAPQGWDCKLAPTENPNEVDTVQFIFQRYIEIGAGFRSVTRSLNAAGIPSPGGGTWSSHTVRSLLKNPVYYGVIAFGKERNGKFHTLNHEGEIEVAVKNKYGWLEDAAIIIEDTHKPLVSKETFDKANEVWEKRRKSGRHPGISDYIVSAIIVCGQCGGPMHGHRFKTRNGKVVRRYVCSWSQTHGPSVCRCYRVCADTIESFLLNLLSEYLSSERDRLKEVLQERTEKIPSRVVSRESTLRTQIASMERKIKRGTENLLEAPDKVAVAEASKPIKEWNSNRYRLKKDLRNLLATDNQDDGDIVSLALDELDRLEHAIEFDDVDLIKGVMQEVYSEVRLYWDRRTAQKKTQNISISVSRHTLL